MSLLRTAAAALLAAALTVTLSPASYADPGSPPVPTPAAATEPPPPPGTEPLRVEHPTKEILAARAKLSALQDEANREAEAYNAARIALDDARQRAVLAQEAAAVADRQVTIARARLSALAAAAYRDGSSAIPALLVSSDDPLEVMQKIATLQVVGGRQTDIFDELRNAQAIAQAAHQDAKRAVAAADRLAREVRAKEAAARTQAKQVAAQLAHLENRQGMAELLTRENIRSAEARVRLPQILADLAAGMKALLAAQSANGTGIDIRSRAAVDGGTLPPNPRTAETIIEALKQLGKVYVWGAEGPDTFDCSGLTRWVWQKVGIDLPHNAAMQFDLLPHVPLDRLLPGDLLFFWDPDGKGGRYIGHVGIYLGRSQMVDAPHTGDFVRIDPVWSTVAGAGRVG